MGDGFQSLQRKDGAVTVVGGQREGGEEVGAENPLLDIRYNELKQIGASLNDDFLLDGAIAGDGGSVGLTNLDERTSNHEERRKIPAFRYANEIMGKSA